MKQLLFVIFMCFGSVLPKITGLDVMKIITLMNGSASGGNFRVDVYRMAPDGPLATNTDFALKPLEKG
ncbi:hypothetical protein [Neolewinella agarilytica]|nr:hypothetical protein [Neolewinella agarilytica]